MRKYKNFIDYCVNDLALTILVHIACSLIFAFGVTTIVISIMWGIEDHDTFAILLLLPAGAAATAMPFFIKRYLMD